MAEVLGRSSAESSPNRGAGLQALGLIQLADPASTCHRLMPHQLREVFVGEPTQFGCGSQCPIDRIQPIDLRQRNGGDHLCAHPCGAHGGSGDEPLLGAWTERQERGLVRCAWPRRAVERTFGWWTEVRWIVAWLAWPGRFPARDLVCTITTDVDDDDRIIVLADPYFLADVIVRNRVLATFELDDG